MTHRRQQKVIFVWLLVIASCGGGNGDGGSESPPPPEEVTLDPTTAPAGSTVKVDGLELDACPLRTSEIRVGGQTAPTVLNDRREAVMRVPLFYDEEAKWATPPAGAQDVEIFCNGDLWHTLPAAITVTELPPAPGTTTAIVADYRQIAVDYRALVGELFPTPGPEAQLFSAIFAAIHELLDGSGPNSLSTLVAELERTEPEVLAILDATHAVSSADEAVADFRELITEMRAEAASNPTQSVETAPKAFVPEIPGERLKSDLDLAKEMQTYVVLKNFSKDVLADTRETFSSGEGWASAISEKFKLAGKVNLVLFIVDYFMNKVVVSVFPATLDKIDLQIAVTELQNSEVTFSQIKLSARNEPVPFTIRDITAIVMTALGLTDKADKPFEAQQWVKSLEEIVPEVTKLALEQLDEAFNKYAAVLPLDYDLELFAVVPQMYYAAWAETRDLYRLYPVQSNVVRPLDDDLEWAASPTYWGSADVSASPAPAPAPSFWGSLYSGGAFGENTTRSNFVEVIVGELAILLEKYEVTVPEGDTASVGVKLSNAPQAEEGPIEVSVSVVGDPDITRTSTVPMVFDDLNWDQYQYITLAAAEDQGTRNGQATVLVTALVDSVGEEPIEVEATLRAIEDDDDRMKFILDPSSVRVPEGGLAEVGVKLNRKPPSKLNAIVEHFSGDRDLMVQSPTIMRFNEKNWDFYKTVTLYAQPDGDREEGRAQFLVSANRGGVDRAYITATEDEEGDRLVYEWTITSGTGPKYTAKGTIPVILDVNADPETVLGSATGTATATLGDQVITGTSTLTVRNYGTHRFCYCGMTECYTNPDPKTIHTLAVHTRLDIRPEDGRDIIVIVGKDAPFSVTYNCGGSTTGTITAELR